MRLIRLFERHLQSTARGGILAAPRFQKFVSEIDRSATRRRAAASAIPPFNHSTFVT
jgi:hypothetical protein